MKSKVTIQIEITHEFEDPGEAKVFSKQIVRMAEKYGFKPSISTEEIKDEPRETTSSP